MIPISQNLQLASQSNVTPWELPYEELFAGLANKQKTFNDRVESIGALNELIPESGLFTDAAKKSYLEDYTSKIDQLSQELSETGKIDPIKVKSLAKDMTTDERVAAMKSDVETWTPYYQKLQGEGKTDQGLHNFYNEDGTLRQTMTQAEQDFFYLANTPYIQNTAEYVDKLVKPNIEEIISASGGKIKRDNLTGALLTFDEETGDYTKDRTQDRLWELTTKGYRKEDVPHALALFKSNDDNVFFYKKEFESKNGRLPTYEDYLRDVWAPALMPLGYLETKNQEKYKQQFIEETGGKKRTGDLEEEDKINPYTAIETLEGYYKANQVVENLKELGFDPEKMKYGDLTKVVNKKNTIVKESKKTGQRFIDSAKKDLETELNNLGIEEVDVNDWFNIEQDDYYGTLSINFNDKVDIDDEARVKMTNWIRQREDMFQSYNADILGQVGSLETLETFKNHIYEQIGISGDWIESKVEKDLVSYISNEFKPAKKGSFKTIQAEDGNKYFTKALSDYRPNDYQKAIEEPDNYIALVENNSIKSIIHKNDIQEEDYNKTILEFNSLITPLKNNLEEKVTYEEFGTDQQRKKFEEQMKSLNDLYHYKTDRYVINNLAVTSNADNTSIKNFKSNVNSLVKSTIYNLTDFSNIHTVYDNKELNPDQQNQLQKALSTIEVIEDQEQGGIKLRYKKGSKFEDIEYGLRYDYDRDEWMFDLNISNLNVDDKAKNIKKEFGNDIPHNTLRWIEIPMPKDAVQKLVYDTGLDTPIRELKMQSFTNHKNNFRKTGSSRSELFSQDDILGKDYSNNNININWVEDVSGGSVSGNLTFSGVSTPYNIQVKDIPAIATLEENIQKIARNPEIYTEDPEVVINALLQDIQVTGKNSASPQTHRDIAKSIIGNIIAYAPRDVVGNKKGEIESYPFGVYDNSINVTNTIPEHWTGFVKSKYSDIKIASDKIESFNGHISNIISYLEKELGSDWVNKYDIHITSGLRSYEETKKLTQDENLEAAPNSNHLRGQAVDIVLKDKQGVKTKESINLMRNISNNYSYLAHPKKDKEKWEENYHLHINL